MADSTEGGEELPVKGEGGVPQPDPVQLIGEAGKGTPQPALALLQEASDMGVRSIGSQRKDGVRGWVDQGHRSDEGRVGRQEPGRGGGQPIQQLGVAFQGNGERLQYLGDAGQESSVEVDHVKELLELLYIMWLRELLDGRDMSFQRSDPVFVDPVAQELNGRGGKSALGWVDHQAILL